VGDLSKQCTLAILAGGKSRRFPPNKLLYPWKGKPLIQYTLSRVLNSIPRTILITNDIPAFSFTRLPMYSDLYPGKGALGGIYTALHYSKTPLVWIVAGDMVNVEPQLLPLLLERIERVDCVIPLDSDGNYEPLCALYHKTCLPAIRNIVYNQKDPSVIELFNEVTTKTVTWKESISAGLSEALFTNINTIEDLKKF